MNCRDTDKRVEVLTGLTNVMGQSALAHCFVTISYACGLILISVSAMIFIDTEPGPHLSTDQLVVVRGRWRVMVTVSVLMLMLMLLH
jgi:hypothetical protein